MVVFVAGGAGHGRCRESAGVVGARRGRRLGGGMACLV